MRIKTHEALDIFVVDSKRYPGMESIKVVSKTRGIRSRTFDGELAWSNANRYVNDKFRDVIDWCDRIDLLI